MLLQGLGLYTSKANVCWGEFWNPIITGMVRVTELKQVPLERAYMIYGGLSIDIFVLSHTVSQLNAFFCLAPMQLMGKLE